MITDAYCRQSFHLVGKYLRRFVSDASDIEAASGMLWASSMGSMAFNVARVGLVHAMPTRWVRITISRTGLPVDCCCPASWSLT